MPAVRGGRAESARSSEGRRRRHFGLTANGLGASKDMQTGRKRSSGPCTAEPRSDSSGYAFSPGHDLRCQSTAVSGNGRDTMSVDANDETCDQQLPLPPRPVLPDMAAARSRGRLTLSRLIGSPSNSAGSGGMQYIRCARPGARIRALFRCWKLPPLNHDSGGCIRSPATSPCSSAAPPATPGLCRPDRSSPCTTDGSQFADAVLAP